MLSFSCNCNIWQLCIKCSSLTSITQLLLLLLPMQHISCLRSSKVDFIYRQPLHVSKDTANTFQNIYAGFKINLQTCTLIHHELHHFVVPIWSGSSFFKTCSNITDFLKKSIWQTGIRRCQTYAGALDRWPSVKPFFHQFSKDVILLNITLRHSY